MGFIVIKKESIFKRCIVSIHLLFLSYIPLIIEFIYYPILLIF